jgi:hypothetical protein
MALDLVIMLKKDVLNLLIIVLEKIIVAFDLLY